MELLCILTIDANILAVILHLVLYDISNGKTGYRVHCILSYNLMLIYNYLNLKSLF